MRTLVWAAIVAVGLLSWTNGSHAQSRESTHDYAGCLIVEAADDPYLKSTDRISAMNLAARCQLSFSIFVQLCVKNGLNGPDGTRCKEKAIDLAQSAIKYLGK